MSFSSSPSNLARDATSAGSSTLRAPAALYRPSRGEPRLTWRRFRRGGRTRTYFLVKPLCAWSPPRPSSLGPRPRLPSSPAPGQVPPGVSPGPEGGVGRHACPDQWVPQTPELFLESSFAARVVLGPSPTAAQAIFSQSSLREAPGDPGRGRLGHSCPG